MAGLEQLTGRIEERQLEEEMRSSYLDYAMSVIVGRALPDVRDGLKPVQRRILYAMYESGLQPNRPYRKSARVVGEVMGNYHPHGDSAIYDTMVRLAQDFSSRYPLVDGQGNFGSIDDDPPAAMRYTEARLPRLATEMVRDIESDTVNFGPNYDESRREPKILPARFPNLLVNGSSGIAVGMATNIPPHNLGEVVDAVIAYINDPSMSVEGLCGHIKGPDFPGGGSVVGVQGIRDAYLTGRGRAVMRADAHSEPIRAGKEAIVVTALPYMVKKLGQGGLVEKIADLVNQKKIPEISDIRDESDRSGMRLVIELKREAIPKVVLNKLYRHTAMQQTFGMNMVALVDGVPRTLNLKDLVHHYLEHQKEVVTRRTKFELRRAEDRAHILEGLLVALANLTEVIELIRASSDPEQARIKLVAKLVLSEKQAQAILDMRLQRLTALESSKIEREHKDLIELIGELRELLGDERMILGVIETELAEIRSLYADERRTAITYGGDDFEMEDLIAEEQVVVTVTHSGYIKRLPLNTYRQQKRGGVGVMGMEMKEGDYIEHLKICSSHDYVLFFTTAGKVYRLKAYELPVGSRTSKGRALVNLLPLRKDEQVRAVIETRDFKDGTFLTFATKRGLIKKTEFLAYNTPIRADGIIAIKLREGDELVSVRTTSGDDDILMVSRAGCAARFHESRVRSMGRATAGVRGMNVAGARNEVLSMDIARDDTELLVVTENGFGKRTPVSDYARKGRGVKGVKTIQLTDRKGALAGARVVKEHQEILLITQLGMVQRITVRGISRTGRSTQGVKLMNLKPDDLVSSVALVVETDTPSPDAPELPIDDGSVDKLDSDAGDTTAV